MKILYRYALVCILIFFGNKYIKPMEEALEELENSEENTQPVIPIPTPSENTTPSYNPNENQQSQDIISSNTSKKESPFQTGTTNTAEIINSGNTQLGVPSTGTTQTGTTSTGSQGANTFGTTTTTGTPQFGETTGATTPTTGTTSTGSQGANTFGATTTTGTSQFGETTGATTPTTNTTEPGISSFGTQPENIISSSSKPSKNAISTTVIPDESSMNENGMPQSEMPTKKSLSPKSTNNIIAKSIKPKQISESPTTPTDQSAPTATLQTGESSSLGLDTMNIDNGGNWIEKRRWFEKAEILFGEIRKLTEQASDVYMDFVHASSLAGKKIEDFSEQVNFDKGQIEEILKNFTSQIDKESIKRGNDLSDAERQLQSTIKTEQKQIEQVGNDIKKVEDFDNQMDATMVKALDTIKACRKLEGSAWNDFMKIGTELDDKQARVLYYQMDNAKQNIDQNITYLKSTLLPYLENQLISTAEQLMTNILSATNALNQKGVNLNNLIQANEKKDKVVAKERQITDEKIVEAEWEKAQQTAQTTAKSKTSQSNWFTKIVMSTKDTILCFGCVVIDNLKSFSCFIIEKVQNISCIVINKFQIIYNKIIENYPNMFESIKNGTASLWNNITMIWDNITAWTLSFFDSLICNIKCIFCQTKSWICSFFEK